jgi:hypothetical protein
LDDPLLTDEAMHARMANGWRAGQPETICGNGSTRAHTENIRRWLPDVVDRLGIKWINDAGAGDLYWIRKVRWRGVINFRAFDLIPRDPNVAQIDISAEDMPHCDAVLCRMVLNHLDEPRIVRAIERFRRTSSFLIATQFNGEDLPQRSPQFTRLDLRRAPYNLGDPLESVQDGSEDICSLAIWRI